MKGKYKNRKNGGRFIIKHDDPQMSEEGIISKEETSAPKKHSINWLTIVLLAAIYTLGFLSFAPAFIPNTQQADNISFVTALGKSTQTVMNPSGRVVVFENAWGFPTVRFVLVNDYSLNKEEGRCVSYKVLFLFDQKRDCFAQTPRNEGLQELIH